MKSNQKPSKNLLIICHKVTKNEWNVQKRLIFLHETSGKNNLLQQPPHSWKSELSIKNYGYFAENERK